MMISAHHACTQISLIKPLGLSERSWVFWEHLCTHIGQRKGKRGPYSVLYCQNYTNYIH